MAIPCTIKEREYDKFVECDGETAVNVKICNPGDINGGGNSNIEFDLADGAVSAIKAIYKTINGVSPGDKDISFETSTIIGISITGSSGGTQIKYQIDGRLEDSSFNFPLNDPLYLGNNGDITNVVPVTGWRVRLGTSMGIGAIQIELEEPIEL